MSRTAGKSAMIKKLKRGREEMDAMAERIVNAVNNTTNDYDAKEEVFSIIQNSFTK